MTASLRKAILLGASALSLVLAPIVLNQTALSDVAAYAKDKGGKGGKDGGNGGGNGKSSSGGNSSNGNSSSGGGNGGGKKVATIESAGTTKSEKAAKTKSPNAQLAGLNSLNRNINGLMNSSDPRMALVREYVQAGADLEEAKAALVEAKTLLIDLQAALDGVIAAATDGLVPYDGSTVYDTPTIESLTSRLGELTDAIALDPDNQAAIDEQTALIAALDVINGSDALVAVNDQQATITGLNLAIAGLVESTSDETLRAALLVAANKDRVNAAGGDAYLTPEIMAWAEGKIDALTEAYIAQQ